MKTPTARPHPVPERAQQRFVRSRPASVLILVVALLVLLALIGTAYISMAQADRYAAQQHQYNTQIDLLVEGVINLATGVITNDLFAKDQFRPAGSTYRHYTGVGQDDSATGVYLRSGINPPPTPGTPWLGDRLPTLNNIAAVPTAPNGNNPPYWRFITAPLIGGQFESPVAANNVQSPYIARDLPGIEGVAGAGTNARWVPTVYQTSGGQILPAFRMMDASGNLPQQLNPVIAADADGDGIADSCLFRLPVGTINGLTYYAGVRIVDNLAAVNVNTAWGPNEVAYPTMDPSMGEMGDFFPSNINLMGLLAVSPGTDAGATGSLAGSWDRLDWWNADGLNVYKFGYTNGVGGLSFLELPGYPMPVVNDNGQPRADFGFWSQPEAAWILLGRRPLNPAYFAPRNSRTYHPLGLTESMVLAHRFVLSDPNLVRSVIERALPYSTVQFAPSQPYAPQNAASWYADNFFFHFPQNSYESQPPLTNTVWSSPAVPTGPKPLRAILTASNPLSSFVPSTFVDRGALTVGRAYQFGDLTQHNGRAFVYIGATAPAGAQPLGAPAPEAAVGSKFWAVEPYLTAPTKISVNTGTFGQLWTAYWSVMVDRTNANGVPPGTEVRQFASPLRDPNPVTTPAPPSARLFRWPSNKARLLPGEVIKLRSALAAVNTINLRQGLSTSPRKIYLQAQISDGAAIPNWHSAEVEATLYGAAPQPYITRVYADTDRPSVGTTPTGTGVNRQGYVGIELYNPYPYAIDLGNWTLGLLQGRTASGAATYPDMKFTPIQGFAGFAGANAVIPANGYMVIDNCPDGAGGGGPADAFYRPRIVDWKTTPLQPPRPFPQHCFVSNLSQVIGGAAISGATVTGGELYLLRPHTAAYSPAPAGPARIIASVTGGVLKFTPVVGGPDEETPGKLYNYVPTDSFDFSGLSMPASLTADDTAIYYARAQEASNDWRFVYPGHWDATNPHPWGAATPYRQEGTLQTTWRAGQRPNGDIRPTSWSPAAAGPGFVVFAFGTVNTGPLGYTSGGHKPCTFSAYNSFLPVQISNFGFPGPFKPPAAATSSASSYGNRFPFGGFARNGDILQVPFIGAYRLRLVYYGAASGTALPLITPVDSNNQVTDGETILEMNSVSMDAQQADDYDTYSPSTVARDDSAENIGRFCPIAHGDVPVTCPVDDFIEDYQGPNAAAPASYRRYRWAMRLLDYLTVESPQDAQLVNADPVSYPPSGVPMPIDAAPSQGVNHLSPMLPPPQTYGRVETPAGSLTQLHVRCDASRRALAAYPGPARVYFLNGPAQGQLYDLLTIAPAGGPFSFALNLRPAHPTNTFTPAANDTFVILCPPEETAPTPGLVNVNTASWRVLAAVPFISSAGRSDQALNAYIAASIVRHRDVDDGTGNPHGPFRSLHELNEVKIMSPGVPPSNWLSFRDIVGGNRSSQTGDFDLSEGDFTPRATGNPDGVTGDFEGTFISMNRISNLLTTRSDSFTVYIVVQGWRDAQTQNPVLVVQRRAAFILDRSAVTPANRSPTIVPVPVD